MLTRRKASLGSGSALDELDNNTQNNSNQQSSPSYRQQSQQYYIDDDEIDDSDLTNVRTPMLIMENQNVSSPNSDGLSLQNKRNYTRLYVGVQSVGALLLLLVLLWLGKYLDGFGFSAPIVTFNFHPFFMILAFIILYSNAMLIYRTFRQELKTKLKLLHAILNGSVVVIATLGSSAAFYFHQKAGYAHFYSLHSWLGITTWALFLSQFSTGFFTFLFPGASYSLRQMLMPFHRFMGVATFVLASATCLTGLNEKAIFSLSGDPKYADYPAAGILINVIGLVLVGYVSLTVYLVTKPEYRRNPLPEEQ